MPTVNITLAGTKAPEAGKKRGRIQSTDGMIFQIDPVMAAGLELNQPYTVNYIDDEFKGNKFRVVEDIKPIISSSAPPPQRAAAPPMKSEGSMSNREMAFQSEIKGAIGMLKAQQPIPVGDRAGVVHALKANILALRDVDKWQRSGNIETSKQRQEEFNDEIPY